ncbi:MAG: glutamine-hydrolyzing carbamoyl-phosphate synthase small subunit [Actinomycetes bacterium]
MSHGYLLLEDGRRFDGRLCGAEGQALGEVVFTTSMSGYQESVSDPSFAGQILAFTLPHVGNYGVSAEAMESDRIHTPAVVMHTGMNGEQAPAAEAGWLDWLRDCGIVAIDEVDTRSLVRHIRGAGSMRGGVFARTTSERDALDEVRSSPVMSGQDLASTVTRDSMVELAPLGEGPQLRIAMIDTGVKDSIVRKLRERGATLELHPCSVSPEQLLAGDADAFFLANGPGDPAALDGVVSTVRAVLGTKPVYGICLGHQLLCRAVGLETWKLPFGHRGANHPVKDLTTGRVEITSQNHGFAVLGPGGSGTVEVDEPVRWDTDFGEAALTHVNLYDRTVEGLALPEARAATVQYHPEAGPGPHDAEHLFDRFIAEIAEAAA